MLAIPLIQRDGMSLMRSFAGYSLTVVVAASR
jgi:hypothetical protein